MRFFYPKKTFLPWLKKNINNKTFNSVNKSVVEIGCGHGDLLREMKAAGIKALGIDPRYLWFDEDIPYDLANCIFPGEAETTQFVTAPNQLIIVCRPCHSGFPANVNDRRHETSTFLYVGLESNIDLDLEGAKYTLLLEDCGNEGENCWLVHKNENN